MTRIIGHMAIPAIVQPMAATSGTATRCATAEAPPPGSTATAVLRRPAAVPGAGAWPRAARPRLR